MARPKKVKNESIYPDMAIENFAEILFPYIMSDFEKKISAITFEKNFISYNTDINDESPA